MMKKYKKINAEDLHYLEALEDRNNKLLQIISALKHKDLAPLYICQDINVYISELTVKDSSISFLLNEGCQAYICCFEGSININQYPSLKERDSLPDLPGFGGGSRHLLKNSNGSIDQ